MDAMLREVERLDPDDLPPPEQLAGALATAANSAQSVFTTGLDSIKAEATATERELFRRSIRLDRIAHASHESSVAFGGTLAERLRTSWSDLADRDYVPWWDQPAK